MTGSFVVSMLTGATLVTAGSLAALRVARTSRAATRHVWLASTFLTLLLLPAAAIIAPRMELAIPAATRSGIAAPAVELISEAVSTDPVVVAAPTRAPEATGMFQMPPWSTVLTAGWLVGAGMCVMPVIIGLCQIRPLRRSGVPWPYGQSVVDRLAANVQLRSRVVVLRHARAAGPMTCGTVHAVILLPLDAEHWSVDALERSLVHELEHVRRRDWASHCVTRMICAAYWFHPLVWIAQRQLTLEAERACDDAVLARSEAAGYAQQLIECARRLSTAPHQALLGMASRCDLATRIRALLDRRQAHGPAGALSVVLAWLVSATLVLAIAPLRIVMADQAPVGAAVIAPRVDAGSQAFEVASIRSCVPETPPPRASLGSGSGGGAQSSGGDSPNFSPGRAYWPCVDVRSLIQTAYVTSRSANRDPLDPINNWPPGVGAQLADGSKALVRGGPAWVYAEKYTIEAKAPDVTANTIGAGSPERLAMTGPMLQSLLEARFRLKVHVEREQAPMLALVVSKSGLKIKPLPDGGCARDRANGPVVLSDAARTGVTPTCNTVSADLHNGNWRYEHGGQALSAVASMLSSELGVTVLDRTGISDIFNITWEFAPDDSTPRALRLLERYGPQPPVRPTAPTVFKALEDELGLTLTPVKEQRAYLVIDHIERPTPDLPMASPAHAKDAGR